MDTKDMERVELEAILETLSNLQEGNKKWEKYQHDSHYDKKGRGFNLSNTFKTEEI